MQKRCIIVPAHKRSGKQVKSHVRCVSIKKKEVDSKESSVKSDVRAIKSKKIDTQTYYKDDPKRKELHQSIEDEVFSQKAGNNKVFYMTGGAPANGKSTYLESSESEIPKDVISIDSDSIKGRLPEYNYLLDKKDMGAAAFVHEESSALSKKFVSRSVNEGKDTLLDGVGNGSFEKLSQKVAGYKANGHKVEANYVSLDTELSVKIARARAQKTGRYVPISYVRAMNREVSRLVPRAVQEGLFDKFTLWDTNKQGQPRQVIRFADGKIVSVNKDLWRKFLAKGGARNVKRYSDLFDS